MQPQMEKICFSDTSLEMISNNIFFVELLLLFFFLQCKMWRKRTSCHQTEWSLAMLFVGQLIDCDLAICWRSQNKKLQRIRYNDLEHVLSRPSIRVPPTRVFVVSLIAPTLTSTVPSRNPIAQTVAITPNLIYVDNVLDLLYMIAS